MAGEEKVWGHQKFWGLGYDFDPLWTLTTEQKKLQDQIVELCRNVIRPKAAKIDETYEFPRENMDALASLGLLGLLAPKELGGRGENHVTTAMVVETIARYGCPSTAMIYVMHLTACSYLLMQHHGSPTLQNVLRDLDKKKLVGTLVTSDPATGSHVWHYMSSKSRFCKDGRIQFLRYGQWATSAGFADFYVVTGVSPSFNGNYSNVSGFLLYKDEARSSADDWAAMGMHGNQSGPLIFEATLDPDRMIGPPGTFMLAVIETGDQFFELLCAACYNGNALACIDVARKHVTRKRLADVSMCVAEFPIIQHYFGEALTETNMSRITLVSVANAMDAITNNNDWDIYKDLEKANLPRRAQYHTWVFQVRIKAAKNVSKVGDKMLHACGGEGYKKDLGLERLVRDGKAGWVMGPSVEVLTQWIGKAALLGQESVKDLWNQVPNMNLITTELRKLTEKEKLKLAERLIREASLEGTDAILDENLNQTKQIPYQDSEFDNPFNTRPANPMGTFQSKDGVLHRPALNPHKFTSLAVTSIVHLDEKKAVFKFSLPRPSDHSGCTSGQYVRVRIGTNGPGNFDQYERFLSPISIGFGHIEVMLKYESNGELSKKFWNLVPGDMVDFMGPCGGYEYIPQTLQHLSLLASGIGIAPMLQIIRDVTKNPNDITSMSLIHYADHESEIPYKDELEAHERKNPKLKLFLTVGEIENANWQGGEGYIDSEMIANTLPSPEEFSSYQVLICGGPAMILSSLQSLFELGYPSEKIFIYGPFGAEQIRTIYGRNTLLSSHRAEKPFKHDNHARQLPAHSDETKF